MRINYSIIIVSDMSRSVAFYRDVIGMPLKFESPEWSEFNTEGCTWALHACDSGSPDTEHKDVGSPGQCRPGFQVPDLGEFHARMLEHGVKCVREPAETFGVKVAQYVDPDGMAFSVGQARTNR